MTSEKCNCCNEPCPMADMAHEAAKGRMYATNEFIALQKKVESGQLVEVVRCRDCKYLHQINENEWYCSHRYGLIVPTPNDFCSYGERRKSDED